MREAMSIRTIPSAPNADEIATALPKVSNAQVRSCCGVHVSADSETCSLGSAATVFRRELDEVFHATGSSGME